jgi:hypothetical protein|tara:strand:- start:1796 stop:2188 length:393 start_codon:yes stop_codon:yes gene_type:complete
MSHFTKIKTSLTDKKELIEALELLQYNVVIEQNLEIKNPVHAEDHEVVRAEIAITDDIGFRWNKQDNCYDLYADHQTWSLDVPVKRFVEKVTQQYARMKIHNTVKEMGFLVEEEWEMDDNSIELTVSRWL